MTLREKNALDRRTETVSRNSNIELLRIIAMIMIIAHHFSVHGEFYYGAERVTVTRLWVQFLAMGGKIGVNIFILISGYFLICASDIKTSKVIRLWLQVFSYSVAIYAVFVCLGLAPFQGKTLMGRLLPIGFREWWFASVYFLLYILSPYINRVIHSMNKRDYQGLLLIMTFFWCVIPTFLNKGMESNELCWFVYLYTLGGYVRLHASDGRKRGGSYIAAGMGMAALTLLLILLCDLIGTRIPYIADRAMYLYGLQALTTLLTALFLFVGFLRIDIGNGRIVNLLASATFGVYLIHDDNYVRPFLWKTLFHNAQYSHSRRLIPYSIAVILVVYAVCTGIELLRLCLVEKRYLSLLNKVSNRVENGIQKVLDNLILDTIL